MIVKTILRYIDNIPLLPLSVMTVVMMLAPFNPEPHLLEKSRMLLNGELIKAIDIFDLFWHSFLILILTIRLLRYRKSFIDKQSD